MASNHPHNHRGSNHPEPAPEGPPDAGAAGDVTTTGHSTHDAGAASAKHGAHGAHDAHDAHVTHGAHGGHTDDVTDVSTLVPAGWKQLILPVLILVIVGILVAGPVMDAFAPKVPSPAVEQNTGTQEGQNQTPAPSGGVESQPTATPAISPTPQGAGATPTTGSQNPALPQANVAATATAVALLGEQGIVSRMPVQLQFGGVSFVVKPGNNLLPDWQPPQEVGIATWIEGTYANHILYLPYSADNEKLFQSARQGDEVKLTMNTGQTFVFAVTRSMRAHNGPPTEAGQFTVTSAMAQDHAGLTLFLIGDPAPDRAVVMADFTGTIQ